MIQISCKDKKAREAIANLAKFLDGKIEFFGNCDIAPDVYMKTNIGYKLDALGKAVDALSKVVDLIVDKLGYKVELNSGTPPHLELVKLRRAQVNDAQRRKGKIK